MEKSLVQVKTQHKISRQWSSSVTLGFNSKTNSTSNTLPVNLEAETEFKYKLSPNNNHVNFYFGLRNSMDGWRYLIGLKIVGIKIKMPLHVITPEDSITTDLVKDAKAELRSTFTVLGVFLLGSYILHWQT